MHCINGLSHEKIIRPPSLLWLKEQGAEELWGLDISAERIAKAEKLLANSDWKGKLFVSPMEINPALMDYPMRK